MHKFLNSYGLPLISVIANGFLQKTEEDLPPHTSVDHSWCRNGINTILVCSPRIILYIWRKLFVQRDVTRRKKCRETNYTHPVQHNARHDLQPPRRWWDQRMSDEGEGMEDGGEATWERRSPRWPRCCGRMWCAGVGPHRHAHKQKRWMYTPGHTRLLQLLFRHAGAVWNKGWGLYTSAHLIPGSCPGG